MDVIFDVDGTLMDNSHRKAMVECAKPDWKSYNYAMFLDVPHPHVCHLAIMYRTMGHRVIITTGRYESDRGLTTDQLRDAGVMFDTMLMRPDGENMEDGKLKLGMLKTLRSQGYDPRIAFDDRDRVVRMWREAGLQCFQVAPGDF
jgi:hypothetical protein